MTVGLLKLIQMLQTRAIPTQAEVEIIQNDLSKYKYPAGMLVQVYKPLSYKYVAATLPQNLQYFENLTQSIYADLYNISEFKILNLFLSLLSENDQILSNIKEEAIIEVLELQTDKEEIQYCLDEIKYHYLTALIYVRPHISAPIDSLIEELLPIEESHNAFHIDAQSV